MKIQTEEYHRFITEIEPSKVCRTDTDASFRVIILKPPGLKDDVLYHSLVSVDNSLNVSVTIVSGKEVRGKIHRHFDQTVCENFSGIANQLNYLFGRIEEDFVLLLPAGDRLAAGALSRFAMFLDFFHGDRANLGAVVMDDDEMADNGQRINPRFKPGFSPDYLLEYDYIGHSVWLNPKNVLKIGGFDNGYSYEFLRNLLLRMWKRDYIIEKIDYIGLHRRNVQAIQNDHSEHIHCIRNILECKNKSRIHIDERKYGPRARYDASDVFVSIIIPFRDKIDYLKTCLESIERLTSFSNYEILLVNNRSAEAETQQYLKKVEARPNVKIIDFDQPFNYSKVNNFAALHAGGDILIFLNNDTEIISPRWLDELSGDAVQPGVGAVSGLLYYHDGTFQHLGVVIGFNGLAGHPFAGEMESSVPRTHTRFRRNVSAVTGACMAIKRSTFKKIGGFCEEFEITGSDVEICLRLMKSGYRNIVNPEVRLYHHEKTTRNKIRVRDVDIRLSLKHYQPFLDIGDPFHNTNVSRNAPALKLNFNEEPKYLKYRETHLKQDAKSPVFSKKCVIDFMRRVVFSTGLLKRFPPDEEVVVYDVHPDTIALNHQLMQRFSEASAIELCRALWFIPYFDYIYRGGLYTIFRSAQYFSEKDGTRNFIVLYGRPRKTLRELHTIIVRAFPKLLFELIHLDSLTNIDRLPESDAAFCTYWTSAYHLVRYNLCRGKFYFVQDFEPGFYPAGSVYGLVEQTYRFGFFGIANTPGVAEAYGRINPWVDYFIPGVDKEIFLPLREKRNGDNPYRLIFYGRPHNPRNGFRLCIESCRLVKRHFSNRIEIISVGGEYSVKESGLKGIVENYGTLSSLEAVASLYRNSDVGLVFMFTPHPSYQPFEYMASGCATVTNFNAGNKWLFRNNENVILTEPTVTCVASRIIEVLENTELRRKVIQGGLTTVAPLNWSDALEKIYSIVKNPIKSRKGRL